MVLQTPKTPEEKPVADKLRPALELLQLGYAPVRLTPDAKKGAELWNIAGVTRTGERGGITPEEARDPERVAERFRGWEGNLGVLCGRRSGDETHVLVVVDVDPRNGGSVSDLPHAVRTSPMRSRTVTQEAGQGGHFFTRVERGVAERMPEHLGNPGVELKGEGRLTAEPPSEAASEVSGELKAYTWDAGPVAFAELPEWDPTAFVDPELVYKRVQRGEPMETPAGTLGQVVERECRRLADAAPGDRHSQLLKTATQVGLRLRDADPPVTVADAGQVMAPMMEAAEACGALSKYGEPEVLRILEEGLEYGLEAPVPKEEAELLALLDAVPLAQGPEAAADGPELSEGGRAWVELSEAASEALRASVDAVKAASVEERDAVDFIAAASHGALAYDSSEQAWLLYEAEDGHWDRVPGDRGTPAPIAGHVARVVTVFTEAMLRRASQLYSEAAREADSTEQKVLQDRARILMGNAKTWRTGAGARSLSEAVRGRIADPFGPDWLRSMQWREAEHDPALLNTPAGVLNLATLETEPRSPRHQMTRLALGSYLPEAEAPRFQDYLEDRLPVVEDRMAFWTIVGLCLLGDNREQVMVLVYGPMKTGKSTLVELVRDALGGYGMMASRDVLGGGSGSERQLESVRDARLVHVDELDMAGKVDIAHLKAITGARYIQVRALYRQPVTVPLRWTLVTTTNEVPQLSTVDPALERRMLALALTRPYQGGQDSRVPRKLRTQETWDYLITRGAQAAHSYLLKHPSSAEALDRLRGGGSEAIRSSGTIAEFFRAGLVKLHVLECDSSDERHTAHLTSDRELYAAYRTFANASGYRPVGLAKFRKAAADYLSSGGTCRHRHGDSQRSGWHGLELDHTVLVEYET